MPIGTDTRNTSAAGCADERQKPACRNSRHQAWNALFAPKGTPQPILDKLTDALDKALSDDGVRKRLLDLGSDPPDKDRRGQQALAALVKSEIARWTPVIKSAGPLN